MRGGKLHQFYYFQQCLQATFYEKLQEIPIFFPSNHLADQDNMQDFNPTLFLLHPMVALLQWSIIVHKRLA